MNPLNRRGLLAFGAVGLGLVVASPTFADSLTPTPRGNGHADAKPTPHGNGNGSGSANGKSADPNAFPQSGNRTPHGRGLMGTISSVKTNNDSNLWTIDTPAWGSVVVSVANARLMAPHGIVSNKSDVKDGDRVALLLTKSQASTSTLTAQTVHVIPGSVFTHVTGKVTSVSPSSITIQTGQGPKTFSIAGDATVLTGHTSTSVGNIQNGNLVTVVVRSDNTATAIAVHNS